MSLYMSKAVRGAKGAKCLLQGAAGIHYHLQCKFQLYCTIRCVIQLKVTICNQNYNHDLQSECTSAVVFGSKGVKWRFKGRLGPIVWFSVVRYWNRSQSRMHPNSYKHDKHVYPNPSQVAKWRSTARPLGDIVTAFGCHLVNQASKQWINQSSNQ